MRELVHVQAGQCGNQIGAKFWEVMRGIFASKGSHSKERFPRLICTRRSRASTRFLEKSAVPARVWQLPNSSSALAGHIRGAARGRAGDSQVVRLVLCELRYPQVVRLSGDVAKVVRLFSVTYRHAFVAAVDFLVVLLSSDDFTCISCSNLVTVLVSWKSTGTRISVATGCLVTGRGEGELESGWWWQGTA
jgi:hypothetical protein